MSEPTPMHLENCKLRLAFLADCRASGMPEHRVKQRYATTEHLVRQAGDKPLWEFSVGELNQLLADTHALSTGRIDQPLSYERMRKVVLHAREMLTYAIEMDSKRFKHQPRHLKNLQARSEHSMLSTDRRPYYTLAEMKQVAAADFGDDWVLKRAQAMACLQYESGMRGGALVTLPLCALDLDNLTVRQDPRMGVKTKLRKAATTAILGTPELIKPVREWYAYLSSHVSPQAMVYNVFDDLCVPPQPTNKRPGQGRIKNLNDDYLKLCAAVDLPYRSSHAFRHGHIMHCVARCETPAEFLALSQNVMHADVKMTAHYGAQDLRAIQAVYANLLAKDQKMSVNKGGEVTLDISAALATLTSVTQSRTITGEERESIKGLTLELLAMLLQRQD